MLVVALVLTPQISINPDSAETKEIEERELLDLDPQYSVPPAVDVTNGPPLEDVLTALKSDRLTKLQVSQFVQRNEGSSVQWRVDREGCPVIVLPVS